MRFAKFVVVLSIIDESMGTIMEVARRFFEKMVRHDIGGKVDDYSNGILAGKPEYITDICKVGSFIPEFEQYRPGLEKMLQAAILLPEIFLGGTRDELCKLSRAISQIQLSGIRGADKFEKERVHRVVHIFWRNQLAEHFFKYGMYEPFRIGDFHSTHKSRSLLEILEGRLAYRYLNFKVHTGYVMPETVESKFVAFIDKASQTFNFEQIVEIWNRQKPFEKVDMVFPPIVILGNTDQVVVCSVGGFEFPRLYKDIWTKIRTLSDNHSTWREIEKTEFCSIAKKFVENVTLRPGLDDTYLMEKEVSDFEASVGRNRVEG